MPVAPPPEIFKAYDIRGLYPEEIDAELAERIGRAFAHVLSKLSGKPVGELRIGLGRDMRLSAPELAARYGKGLSAEGASVIDIGQVGSRALHEHRAAAAPVPGVAGLARGHGAPSRRGAGLDPLVSGAADAP
jgi:phosphomannomutase